MKSTRAIVITWIAFALPVPVLAARRAQAT
jgi:hypothetical protein